MSRFQHAWPRKHTAEMNGVEVEFKSCHFEKSYHLWCDALQACREAGVFREKEDADRMLIDGEPATWE